MLYYEREAHGLGSAFVTTVERGLQQLLRFPESGRRIVGQIRAKPIGRFPYSILYSVQPYGIRVLAVMNQRRRPLYWVARE
ncbi:MAG: type II toxin-antitoxin system RelE/ParE family toxin [Thermoanaerobaculia bacterium]|nr:type II toxin-antitoxin system RelE/ParE family toxin [Thermoanaerobaculia bacterium]